MTPQPHCDHEKVCFLLRTLKSTCPIYNSRAIPCIHNTRSRPAPPAPEQEPDWMKGYPPEMRAWAEACNLGAEEQYIREQREEAAKTERERVLEEQNKRIVFDLKINQLKHGEYLNKISKEIERFMLEESCDGRLVLFDESLQSGQEKEATG